jgi:hypothetical protein
MEDSNEGDVSPDCFYLLQIMGGPALSNCQILEPQAHFTVNDSCELAVTGIAIKAIYSYECSLISQLNLTDALEVEEAIRVLKINKVVGSRGRKIPETSMKA